MAFKLFEDVTDMTAKLFGNAKYSTRNKMKKMKRNSPPLSIHHFFWLVALSSSILVSGSGAESPHSRGEPSHRLQAFTNFLSSPPTIAEVTFARVLPMRPMAFPDARSAEKWARRQKAQAQTAGGFTNLFEGLWQTNAFLLRELPLSAATNAATFRGAYFAGRYQDLMWAIEDKHVTFSSLPSDGDNAPDDSVHPILALVQACEGVLAEALTLGAAGVRVGSFTWSGLAFRAQTHGGEALQGRLYVGRDGAPARMEYTLPGNSDATIVSYSYTSDSASLDIPLPDSFSRRANGSQSAAVRYILRSLQTTSTNLPRAAFLPDRFLRADDTLILYTNKTLLTFQNGKWAPVPTALQQAGDSNRYRMLRWVLFVVVILPLPVLAWRAVARRMAQRKSKETNK